MRDINEFQVWKEEYITSLNIDDMDEFDEELFLLNKNCENINITLFDLEDWIDPQINLRLSKIALESDDFKFYV